MNGRARLSLFARRALVYTSLVVAVFSSLASSSSGSASRGRGKVRLLAPPPGYEAELEVEGEPEYVEPDDEADAPDEYEEVEVRRVERRARPSVRVRVGNNRAAPRQRRVVYEDGLPYCQNNLDCPGTGNWCKDRGDGIKLCMNDGRSGDYCTSGIDCDRGHFCKDRGDGLKMCMGSKSGRRGDFCSSSIDCGRGAWCKDRGDGMKVCM